MKFNCRSVDLRFLESAPVRFVNEVEINASPEQVFKVFEDGESWPKWFKDIIKVEWTSPKPFGVGTTRTVNRKPMIVVYEQFIAWDPGKRFTFFLTAINRPIVHALCEDYRLESLGNGKTKFTYIVAYEPRLLNKLAGPIGRWYFRNMCHNAALSLAAFMEKNH